ncbi:MAG: hypothetical protein CBC55_02215 [Gammaproteobacteria bacterium TMED95]|uniref:Uncharacterized protein n=1 Tax=Alteromonas mediterranea TaxID=314275 RepID=A0AAC9JE67_9ALTE|nr:hypothetical protein [Alteromonas mediterranea]APD92080.1 hypothetical protein BM524_19355 [Alteromonas mediterranea]APD99934.1 hypothetical protein BM525_19550 [Alteromonas mediterranea]OUV22872.1 MAG: hypothetical protein CBC55_02215 [Gammaproteobacteria bacterium TMED95]|tara:strand:+ start:2435 stop:2779 length:345 start_codon:yes stop_codon:yes gene_type:complete
MSSINLSEQYNAFISQTAKGQEFHFAANLSGRYNQDGTVEFNDSGLVLSTFNSIEDFASHHILGQKTPHLESYYVADRQDDGDIIFFGAAYNDAELDLDSDGTNIFTKPVKLLS